MDRQPPNPSATSNRTVWFMAAAVGIMLAVHALPTPPPLERSGEVVELTSGGKATMAILAFAVVLWITEAIPFAATALFVLLLIPVFGVTSYAQAVQLGFGHPIITFFIGVLILSAGFSRSGLGTRMALLILHKVGTRTDRVLLGFLVAGASLSMWITDMAVAAILLPLAVSLLEDSGLERLKSNFGRALMIACAFGPLIGGIATPAGTGANPIALSYMSDLAGIEISFVKWMAYGLPASVLMLPGAWLLLLRIFPPEIERLPMEREEIAEKLAELGPLQSAEIKTLVVFAMTISLWLVTPLLNRLSGGAVNPPIQAVALFGGISLFLPKMNVLSWKQAQHDVEWGGIVLVAAGISLGLTVFETGAAHWLALVLMGEMGAVPALLRPFLIVLSVAMLHMLFSSNTVTGTIIIPILIALAASLGLAPWTLAGPAAFTSSLAFILVTETPTNVIPYSSGYFSIRDMAKVGIPMTFIAALCVTASMLIVGAIIGG